MAPAPDRSSDLELAQTALGLASSLAAILLFTSACGLGPARTLAWLAVSLILMLTGFFCGRVLSGFRVPTVSYAVVGGVIWVLLSISLHALLPGLRDLHIVFVLAPAALAGLALTAGLFHQPWGAPLNFGAGLLLIYMSLLKVDEFHPLWFPLASFLWIAALHVQRTRRAWLEHPDRPAIPARDVMRQAARIYACLAALFIPFWILSLARVDVPHRADAAASAEAASINPRLMAILAGAGYAALIWMIMHRLLRRKRAANLELERREGWDGGTSVEAGARPRGRRLYEESGLQGRVIQDYAQFLARLKKGGTARAESQTPRELMSALASASPGSSSALAEITRVYESARYGFEEIEHDDYDRFQSNLERLNSVGV